MIVAVVGLEYARPAHRSWPGLRSVTMLIRNRHAAHRRVLDDLLMQAAQSLWCAASPRPDLFGSHPRVIDKPDILTEPDILAGKSRIPIKPSRVIEVGKSMQ
jgi:hypothetical protein